MAITPTVFFHFNKQKFNLYNRKRLKAFINSIFKKEGIPLNVIRFIFCSDKELLEINNKYLGHDSFTDIITFDLSDDYKGRTAEVYISIERIRDNSKAYNVSFSTELHRVFFHGVLHLCGYGDKSKKDKLTMIKKEDYYLSAYFG